MLAEFVDVIRSRVIHSLGRYLSSLGFRIESPAKLIGTSGVEHWADLSATGPDGGTILLDICVSHDIINEEPVIATYAKVLDTSPSHTYLLVMPRANSAASELAKSYKIRLIEGVSAEDLIMRFEQEFPLQLA